VVQRRTVVERRHEHGDHPQTRGQQYDFVALLGPSASRELHLRTSARVARFSGTRYANGRRMGSLWSSWRLPAAISGVVVAVLVAIAPRVAQAQILTISESGITREAPIRADITGRFKVSRSDCLLDDVISFPLVVSNYAGSNLEVWATQSTSDDCTTETARTTASATCWQVYRVIPSNTTITVPIRVQDFAQRPPTTSGIGVGTDASCEGTTSTGQPVKLWFMFLQGATQVGQAQSWQTTVDLLGPAPPSVSELGPGNGMLKLSWSINSDPDVVAYRTFCEDLGAQTAIMTYEAGAPRPEASIPPPATCDAGASEDGGEDGGSTEDAGDTAEAGTEGDAACKPMPPDVSDSGSGPTADCPASFLQGQTLSPEQIKKYECGSTGRTATSVTITGVINGHKYAVAVAASDLVENAGALSSVQCAIPVLTDSFDQVYRNAGGTAGGNSFCSVGVGSGVARSTLWPGAAFAAVVALRRWRRRRAV
jgi:hypothetical protein